MFDELTLIDHVVCQPRPDEGKIPVAIDGTQRVTQSRPMDAVNPVDPIEALHDPYAAPPRFPYLQQMPGAPQHEERIGLF